MLLNIIVQEPNSKLFQSYNPVPRSSLIIQSHAPVPYSSGESGISIDHGYVTHVQVRAAGASRFNKNADVTKMQVLEFK